MERINGIHRPFVVVALIFLVAITPSLSDIVQINDQRPGSWKVVAIWYIILIVLLAAFWEALS